MSQKDVFFKCAICIYQNNWKKTLAYTFESKSNRKFLYFAPAQGGKHSNGRETFGHSLIISPDGKIIKA